MIVVLVLMVLIYYRGIGIKVFGVAKDGKVSGLFSIPLPPANAPRRTSEIPAGLALAPDGQRLYVAGNLSNRVLELDTTTGKVLRMFDVGSVPYDVVLVGTKSAQYCCHELEPV